MKFIFADAQDTIDLDYNFLTDEFSPKRVIQRTDKYPHEVFSKKPYDGMLISRGLLDDGVYKSTSRAYSMAQTQRLKMEGVKRFLRYYDGEVFGDNGAFSYHKLDEPPYKVAETVFYYEDCGFDYGMSVDHIIFEYDKRFDTDGDFDGKYKVTEKMQKRYDITINNARDFLKECTKQKVNFHPIGVIQAWSPKSMKKAARELVNMGYDYIAIGGMVPLDINSCEEIVKAVREEIGFEIKIHLLGFAKAKQLERLGEYRKVRDEFMRLHPTCQARLSGCTVKATDLHHSKGRTGDLLTDKRHFKALCRSCHRFIEENPKFSKENGYSENRI